MSFLHKFRSSFSLVLAAIFALFMGTMVIVVWISYSRSFSGVTKIDMGKMQKIRHEVMIGDAP